MSETTAAIESSRELHGSAIPLPDGREVALFRDGATGTNVIRLTNGDRVTRIVVSDIALAALVALTMGDDGGLAA